MASLGDTIISQSPRQTEILLFYFNWLTCFWLAWNVVGVIDCISGCTEYGIGSSYPIGPDITQQALTFPNKIAFCFRIHYGWHPINTNFWEEKRTKYILNVSLHLTPSVGHNWQWTNQHQYLNQNPKTNTKHSW